MNYCILGPLLLLPVYLYVLMFDLVMQVEEIDDVAKNLAQVIATERTLIEECGNLLYQAHNLQVWVQIDSYLTFNQNILTVLVFYVNPS